MPRHAHLPTQGAQQAFVQLKTAEEAVSGNLYKSCSTVPVLSKNSLWFDSITESQHYLGGYTHGCATSIEHWMVTIGCSHPRTFYTTIQDA